MIDKDGSGTISTKELGFAMKTLGEPKSDAELAKLVAEVDVDGNKITLNLPSLFFTFARFTTCILNTGYVRGEFSY